MSTGFECLIFEHTPGAWFYLLQNWDCPRGAWDWREHATCTGPFSSDEAAHEHLRRHEANPGGYSIEPWSEGQKPDPVMERCVQEARNPNPSRPTWPLRAWPIRG